MYQMLVDTFGVVLGSLLFGVLVFAGVFSIGVFLYWWTSSRNQ